MRDRSRRGADIVYGAGVGHQQRAAVEAPTRSRWIDVPDQPDVVVPVPRGPTRY